MSKVVFENETYIVKATGELELSFLGNTYIGGYEVVNIQTGITEFMTTSLPEAMFNAEQLHGALASEAWKWRRETPPETVPTAPNPLTSMLN